MNILIVLMSCLAILMSVLTFCLTAYVICKIGYIWEIAIDKENGVFSRIYDAIWE